MNKRKIQEVKTMYSKLKTQKIPQQTTGDKALNEINPAFFNKIINKLNITTIEK